MYTKFASDQLEVIYHTLIESSVPIDYLQTRGLTEELAPHTFIQTGANIVNKYGLPSHIVNLLKNRLVMFSETLTGTLDGMDLRSLDSTIDRQYRFTKLGGPTLWNHTTINRTRNLIITEGVMDAMSIRSVLFPKESYARINQPQTELVVDAVATFGVKASPVLLDYLAATVDENYTLFVGFDSDSAGRETTNKVIDYYHNVLNISNVVALCPGDGCKDWNEYYQKGLGSDRLRECLLNQIMPFIKK